MTDTKPDLIARAHETSLRRPRGRWLWFSMVAVVAAGVLAAVLLWPDDEPVVLTENPPYGLTGVEMPETEDELVAVLERLPEIDGRQPTFMREEDMVSVVYEGTESEAPGIYRSIQVLLNEPPGPGDEPWDLEYFIDDVELHMTNLEQEEGWIIEASAIDPNDDLVWMVMTDPETEDGVPAFHIWWAEPVAGGDIYALSGDTADFRLKLVHAFVSAIDQ